MASVTTDEYKKNWLKENNWQVVDYTGVLAHVPKQVKHIFRDLDRGYYLVSPDYAEVTELPFSKFQNIYTTAYYEVLDIVLGNKGWQVQTTLTLSKYCIIRLGVTSPDFKTSEDALEWAAKEEGLITPDHEWPTLDEVTAAQLIQLGMRAVWYLNYANEVGGSSFGGDVTDLLAECRELGLV